ncbi:MAG: hypothetical protein ACE37F_21945 [Nannocystaceae bacterium]|nr:hypothetical protein [bacterium]
MKHLWLPTALALLCACSDPPTPHSRPKESPRPDPAAEQPAAEQPPSALQSAQQGKGPGPLPQSDQEVGRRAAVYALLAGGDIAKNLPERASDPGTAFDSNLADDMTPAQERSSPH